MTEEEIKYHNRLWYYKTYNQLIDRCIQMEKDGYPEDMYTEVHHILPKCQGGTNEKCNLVKMPVRYHIMAHILLAYAFPEEKILLYAAGCMISLGNKFTNEQRKLGLKSFSTKIIADIREKSKLAMKGRYAGDRSPSWGRKASEETKRKQSLAKKGKYSGKNHPNYGKHWSKSMKDKISKTLRENKTCAEGNNPSAKKVIGPDGTVYDCITNAGKDYGVTRKTISRWIKDHPEKGFRFYIENNNDN